MFRNLIDPFSLTSSGPAFFYSLLESLDIVEDSENNTIRSIPLKKILLRTCSFIFPWPGYIANRGRTDVPPERTWRPVLRAMGPKQGESAKRARLRVQLEFICLSSSISKGEAAIIVFVYLTIFATLLIDLLACEPLFKYEHASINNMGP